MITLFLLMFLTVLVIVGIAVVFAAITGILAFLPAMAIIAALILIDVVFFMGLAKVFKKKED